MDRADVSQRAGRSIGKSGGDDPIWIVAWSSNPCRWYSERFAGLVDPDRPQRDHGRIGEACPPRSAVPRPLPDGPDQRRSAEHTSAFLSDDGRPASRTPGQIRFGVLTAGLLRLRHDRTPSPAAATAPPLHTAPHNVRSAARKQHRQSRARSVDAPRPSRPAAIRREAGPTGIQPLLIGHDWRATPGRPKSADVVLKPRFCRSQ